MSSFMPANGGELVLHLLDADGGDGGAGERAEKDTAQGVAYGGAEASLQRLGDDAGVRVSRFLDLDLRGRELSAEDAFSLWTQRLWRYQFSGLPLC